MTAIASQVYFRFLVCHVLDLRRSKIIGLPKFYQISQSTAEIPVSENK